MLHRICQRKNIAITVLLIVYVGLGLVYSFSTPLFEGPDETGHYAFVAHLVRGEGLPIQSFDPAQNTVYQGHHPPLYYAFGALMNIGVDLSDEPRVLRYNPQFIWGGRGVELNAVLHTAGEQWPFTSTARLMHLVRMLSLILGAVTVWSTYRVGQIVTGRESIALGAAALVAFNPQFLFVSSVVNTDNAVIAFSALALVIMATILVEDRTRRRAIWLGIWLGLAILSKLSALVLILPVLWTVAFTMWRERSWRAGGELLAWVGLSVLIIDGWWLVRNLVLYGDPLGYGMYLAAASSLQAPIDLQRLETWRSFLEITHQTFWGNFGWAVIPLKPPLNQLFAILYPAAVGGALIGWIWRRENGAPRRMQWDGRWPLLIITVLAFILWTINFARTNGGSAFQGRYLFPAIAAIAVMLIAGLSALVPDRFRWVPIGAVIIPLVILAVSVPGQYIAPVYRYFTVPESTLSAVPDRLNGTFSPEIALAGFRAAEAHTQVDVTLYWKAQGIPPADYKVFIHALNDSEQVCGQRDALTQDGVFPMTFWRAGDVIEDQQRIPIDPECCGAAGCQLQVGLYREDTGERLLYSLGGQPVSDHVEIRP